MTQSSAANGRHECRSALAADGGGGDLQWRRLMAAAQDGDGSSYERLLREIAPVVRRAAHYRWRSARAADIEDVVQDVLLSLHSVRHTYDPARPFRPWLMAILHCRLVDSVRRSARRNANEVVVEAVDKASTDGSAPREDDRLADRDALHKAITALPAGQRRAVECLKLKELSLREAAAETGMTVAALKVSMHRALRSLRAAMTKDDR